MRTHNEELEIDEDIGFERKTWAMQRIGWAIMFIIVLAAMLGFTGRGGLLQVNKVTATTPDKALEVEYERFQRREADSELKIKLKDVTASTVSLQFSKDFYTKQRIDKVLPEPETVKVNADGIVYTFSVGSTQSEILFHTHNTTFGKVQFHIQSPTGSSVPVQYFVYP